MEEPNEDNGMHENRLGNLYGDFGTGYAGNVWDDQGIAPALMTMQGGGRQPMIIESVCVGSMQEHAAIKTDGICTTLTSAMGLGGGQIPMVTETKDLTSEKGVTTCLSRAEQSRAEQSRAA